MAPPLEVSERSSLTACSPGLENHILSAKASEQGTPPRRCVAIADADVRPETPWSTTGKLVPPAHAADQAFIGARLACITVISMVLRTSATCHTAKLMMPTL